VQVQAVQLSLEQLLVDQSRVERSHQATSCVEWWQDEFVFVLEENDVYDTSACGMSAMSECLVASGD